MSHLDHWLRSKLLPPLQLLRLLFPIRVAPFILGKRNRTSDHYGKLGLVSDSYTELCRVSGRPIQGNVSQRQDEVCAEQSGIARLRTAKRWAESSPVGQ